MWPNSVAFTAKSWNIPTVWYNIYINKQCLQSHMAIIQTLVSLYIRIIKFFRKGGHYSIYKGGGGG